MLFSIIGLAFVFVLPAQAQETIGYVIEIKGNWVLNNDQRLSRWQGVPSEGVISIASPKRDDRITIVSGNKTIASRICSQPNMCNDSIRLPRTEPATSSIWRWVTNKLFGDAGRYAPQRSRGEEGNLLESVALLKDGQLNMSAMFKEMPKGKYEIVILTVPQEGKRKRLGPIPVDWNPDSPSAVAVPTVLTPGLYQVDLSSAPDELKSDAWVLVRSPAEYEEIAASFASAKATTKEWGDQVESDTISSFLRAHLDYLATQGAK